jgi:hypothetical protein
VTTHEEKTNGHCEVECCRWIACEIDDYVNC